MFVRTVKSVLRFQAAPAPAVLARSAAALPTLQVRARHTLPELPYDYNALEPIIAGDIMRLHHQKHHATYVNNLNQAEEKLSEAMLKQDVSKAIELGQQIKFNGGGHLNHSILWKTLSPNGGGEPVGDITDYIRRSFGSSDNMIRALMDKALAIQGSGWAWLGYCSKTDGLQIATCANQDPLQAITGLFPLFGIDMWEHAYYLQYKNAKGDYVKNIFNIANWEEVNKRLVSVTQAKRAPKDHH